MKISLSKGITMVQDKETYDDLFNISKGSVPHGRPDHQRRKKR